MPLSTKRQSAAACLPAAAACPVTLPSLPSLAADACDGDWPTQRAVARRARSARAFAEGEEREEPYSYAGSVTCSEKTPVTVLRRSSRDRCRASEPRTRDCSWTAAACSFSEGVAKRPISRSKSGIEFIDESFACCRRATDASVKEASSESRPSPTPAPRP